MDSGIYRLTYRTGETYVGKSIHLKTRWRQHFDKLSKGKAAKNMQDAYEASGHHYPRTEVLLHCHPDMLDYYEGYFINHLQPELNTSIPEELPDESKRLLVFHANHDMAHYSVIETIQALHKTVDDLEESRDNYALVTKKVAEVEGNFDKLSASWTDRAVRDNWEKREYRRALEESEEFAREVGDLEAEVGELKSWQLRVKEAGWWQRLWRSW